MASCVEKLTTSGQQTLDAPTMAQIKKICKRSDEYVKHAFHLVMSQLECDHAEIRLSAFLIIQQLFSRSHCFRELLLARFHSFMQLTMETEPNIPMPPPKLVANSLKKMASDSVQEWYNKYGLAYKKLALAYDYLKTCKKVSFDDVDARSLAERQREEVRMERQQRQREEKLRKVMAEISDMEPEIQMCLTQLDNCLQLLLPSPDNFDIAEVCHAPSKRPSHTVQGDSSLEKDSANVEKDSANVEKDSANVEKDSANVEKDSAKKEKYSEYAEKDSVDVEKDSANAENDSSHVENDSAGKDKDEDGDFVRQHGLGSINYSIQVCVGDIQLTETEDNVDLLDTLQDSMRLVSGQFLPSTRHWLEAMTKCGGSQVQISHVLGMKQSLEQAKHKMIQLKIRRRTGHSTPGTSRTRCSREDREESEEEDFEEVPQKEGYEATVPDYPSEESQLSGRQPWKGGGSEEWALSQLCAEEGDPTTGQASVSTYMRSSTEQGSRKLMTDAANNKQSTSSSGTPGKSQSLETVPVVPYGTDLLDWGQDFEVPLVARFDMGHRFWAPPREEIVDKNALESKRCRLINFTGKFEPVKWACRAPLPSGQLCPRMDRLKCPFHGKIIARDELGRPTKGEDVKREEEQTGKQDGTPEWEDPELQREIQAATGVDLRRKGKGKGRGKQSNLTDLRESGTSSRKRLEAKVFKSLNWVDTAVPCSDTAVPCSDTAVAALTRLSLLQHVSPCSDTAVLKDTAVLCFDTAGCSPSLRPYTQALSTHCRM
ncbi:UV-stimulated scaffold protein A [Lamellibrachia satsuma]|nr:UV-stimulated scaffold protein A [Lamellibrachia satsuma]